MNPNSTGFAVVFDHSAIIHFDQVAKNRRFRDPYPQSDLIHRGGGMLIAEILINVRNDALHLFCAQNSAQYKFPSINIQF